MGGSGTIPRYDNERSGGTHAHSRLPKGASDINAVETLVIPEGFYVDGSFTNDNVNISLSSNAVFKDGKIYIAWWGHWNGVFHGWSRDEQGRLVAVIENDRGELTTIPVPSWRQLTFVDPPSP